MSAIASPFTPEQQKSFDAQTAKILAQYPADRKSAALIPVLHVAQGLHGWLKPEAMDYCGEVCGVPATRVREVVTFYSMFHLKPVGKTHVGVCVNISCWLMGADKLVERCKSRIGAEPFAPTADSKLSWCEVECLAACGGGPSATVNETYYENLTVEQLDKLIDEAGKK